MQKHALPLQKNLLFFYNSQLYLSLYQVRLDRDYWEVDTGFGANQARLG